MVKFCAKKYLCQRWYKHKAPDNKSGCDNPFAGFTFPLLWSSNDEIHVTVVPAANIPMRAWIKAGSDSIWFKAVKSVVVKWDGGNKNRSITVP